MTAFRTRDGVLVEPIGAMWAAFSPASGDTQLLNDEAAAFVELLAERPLTPGEAAAALAGEIGADPLLVGQGVDDTFHALRMAGLIEQIIPADDVGR